MSGVGTVELTVLRAGGNRTVGRPPRPLISPPVAPTRSTRRKKSNGPVSPQGSALSVLTVLGPGSGAAIQKQRDYGTSSSPCRRVRCSLAATICDSRLARWPGGSSTAASCPFHSTLPNVIRGGLMLRVIRQRDEVIRDHLRRTRNTSHGTTKDSRAYRCPRRAGQKPAAHTDSRAGQERKTAAHTDSRAGQKESPLRMPPRAERKSPAYAAPSRTEDRHLCRPRPNGRSPRLPRRAGQDCHA
jgi:hypothetical protein